MDQQRREWLMRPNLLPPNHTREDFDFQQGISEYDYAGQKIPNTKVIFMAPFRLEEYRDQWGTLLVPQKVWCKKHVRWEDEFQK